MFTCFPDRASDDYSQLARQWLLRFLAFGAAAYLLLWVAIFNGYPVAYPDTEPYLVSSFTLYPPAVRTIFYSFFVRLVSFGITPWLVVVAQSVITVFIVYTTLEYLLEEGAPSKPGTQVLLGLVAFLAMGTSLPWFVGQLMPDVFTGLAFLSAYLLLYDTNLSWERAILVSCVFGISVGSHLSNLLSVSLLFAAILALSAFGRARQLRPKRSGKALIGFLLVPIVASTTVDVLPNWRNGMGPTPMPAGHVFLLARLLESGLAGDYLKQRCKFEQLTAWPLF